MEDASIVIAAAAGVVAIIAIAAVGWLWVQVRSLRRDQRVLLPEGTSEDLAGRQAELARSVAKVESGLADLEALVGANASRTDAELANALRFRGLVRYDAYAEMGGSQSWSIALLDEHGTGAVISCLHARDHARIYLKEVVEGASGQRLSPEEQRSIAGALGVEHTAQNAGVQVSETPEQAPESQ
jgi:hypothetical protein